MLPFLIFAIISSSVTGHTCSSPSNQTSKSSCPPFTSIPPFPFSISPGCGHPSFQLKCSSPHSLITINDFTYFLLSYHPNSSSLILSPQPHSSPHTNNCSSSYTSIPSRSINLTGSPFRVSDSTCTQLSKIPPCSPTNLHNCSFCRWECNLTQNPLRLLHDCGIAHNPASQNGSQTGVLESLDKFVRNGFQVEYDESQDSHFSRCKDCKSKNGICGFNTSDPHKQFICLQPESKIWIREQDPNRIVVFCSIFTMLCLFIIVLIIAVIFRSKHLKSLANEEDPTTLFLHRHRSASLLPPVFTYEELQSSTNQFDPARKIGDGGFGSVYLGQLHDGRIVAVKYLHNKQQHRAAAGGNSFSKNSFCNEILILSSINHQNLVKLHGYCSDPRGLLLIYDYVPNGTLAYHLHGPNKKTTLTWQVRLEIALQTALAIEYLHFATQPAVVHRDITSSNIFVERDMRIKLGDFGLSRLLIYPETTSSSRGVICTGPQGTPGYLDPDYHRSFRLTEKSDVYSFGVVLFELITGMRAVDQRRDKREIGLADLVVGKIYVGQLWEVVDPVLKGDGEARDGVCAVAELAFRCVAAEKDDRPDSKEVVEELKRIRSRTRGLRGR